MALLPIACVVVCAPQAKANEHMAFDDVYGNRWNDKDTKSVLTFEDGHMTTKLPAPPDARYSAYKTPMPDVLRRR